MFVRGTYSLPTNLGVRSSNLFGRANLFNELASITASRLRVGVPLGFQSAVALSRYLEARLTCGRLTASFDSCGETRHRRHSSVDPPFAETGLAALLAVSTVATGTAPAFADGGLSVHGIFGGNS